MIKGIKKIRIISVFALLILFTAVFAPGFTARANSAQTSWRGRDSFGAYVLGEDCPVVVAGEKLTLHVPGFPKNYYSSAAEIEAYGANVTAEYAFSNPSDLDVEMTLVFPFGERPDYIYDFYDFEKGEYVYFDDTAKYAITADGEVLERTVRHTYSTWNFNAETDLSKLSYDKREKDIYATQTPVTVYTYEYKTDKNSNVYAPHIAADFKGIGDKKKTRVFLDYMNSYQSSLTHQRYGFSTRGIEGAFSMYVIGEPLTEMPEWKFFTNGGLTKTMEGEINLLPEYETTTFGELALAKYDGEKGISETDWYNAVLDCITRNDTSLVHFDSIDSFNVTNNLMRWYEYKLNIPAGGTVVNSVTAPLYPSINGNWSPPVYSYTYLLSPASTWADFGSLEVKIDTPYYIVQTSLDFQKVDGGYKYTSLGLPDGELTFALSTVESVYVDPPLAEDVLMGFFIVVIAFIIVFSLLRTAGLIIAAICIAVKRHRR